MSRFCKLNAPDPSLTKSTTEDSQDYFLALATRSIRPRREFLVVPMGALAAELASRSPVEPSGGAVCRNPYPGGSFDPHWPNPTFSLVVRFAHFVRAVGDISGGKRRLRAMVDQSALKRSGPLGIREIPRPSRSSRSGHAVP